MHSLAASSQRFRKSVVDQSIQRASGILHLGAHLGQEAQRYADAGKRAVWVEAIPAIHGRLKSKIEKFPNQLALCALLGDSDGALKRFHISNNDEGVSSSIFDFGPYGAGAESLWPQLSLNMVDRIDLPTVRLDTLLDSQRIDPRQYDCWVLDLQGAELLALQGAGQSLRHCRALLVEVSTVPVYEGGVLWPQLREWLAAAGFVPLWEPELPHDDVLFAPVVQEEAVFQDFRSEHYVRHNLARLTHLASLGLPLENRRVLEVGAGPGDHTGFYLERGCTVRVTDARPEILTILRRRFGGEARLETALLDMDDPPPPHSPQSDRVFDLVHCYGLLYHLQRPQPALAWLAARCSDLLVLETCVSYGSDPALNPVGEPAQHYSQSFHGMGCRPARVWVWDTLRALFPYVYVTSAQPAHEEFPLDWSQPPANPQGLSRSVFVASRHSLDGNPSLSPVLLQRHRALPDSH